MSEWIKCSDKMPNKFDGVLFYDHLDGVYAGYWNDTAWVPFGRAIGDSPGVEEIYPVCVSHWMPLPEPPNE